MNRISAKLMCVMAIFLFIAVIPIVAFATNEDISIVESINEESEKEYTIYLKEMSAQKFKYAFTNIQNANPNGMDLSYINSISDLRGNQVAFLDATTYEKLSKNNQTIYMWAKVKEEEGNEKLVLENVQLDLSEALKEENLNQVENLTQTIKVEIADSQEDTTTIKNENVDGINETTNVGYVKISDNEKNAKYYYEMVKLPSSEEYNKLKKLTDQLNAEYNEKDMYEKIQIATEFSELFETVTSQANWKEVTDMTIKQDENSKAGDQYIVLLKKVSENGEETLDVQILTAEETETEEKETIQVETQETTKLPITYDSIALFVILGIIVVLAVIVFIRMKKVSKKNETK